MLLAYIEILRHFSLQILGLYFKFVPGVLFCSLSAFVTNHTTPTSYIIHLHGFHVQQSAEVRKKCLLRLKYKRISTFVELLISVTHSVAHTAPRSCVSHNLLWMRALYLTTVVQKHLLTAMIELRRARTILNITPIEFV